MSQTAVYEENTTVTDTAMEPFIRALLPTLRAYGVTHTNQVPAAAAVQGPDLKYDISDGYSDGYSASSGYKKLRSSGLLHPITGEVLDISIEIDLQNYTPHCPIAVRIAGEIGVVEKLKAEIRRLIQIAS